MNSTHLHSYQFFYFAINVEDQKNAFSVIHILIYGNYFKEKLIIDLIRAKHNWLFSSSLFQPCKAMIVFKYEKFSTFKKIFEVYHEKFLSNLKSKIIKTKTTVIYNFLKNGQRLFKI